MSQYVVFDFGLSNLRWNQLPLYIFTGNNENARETREDPRAKRVMGAYDDPYGSPGQYTSPRPTQGGSEKDEPPPRRRKFTRFSTPTPERDTRVEGRSLLSMVGDQFVDANVAANEKEVRSYTTLN